MFLTSVSSEFSN